MSKDKLTENELNEVNGGAYKPPYKVGSRTERVRMKCNSCGYEAEGTRLELHLPVNSGHSYSCPNCASNQISEQKL